MGNAQCDAQTTEGRLGVAFFGESSLQADLKAFEWACTHLPVSNKHKLQIIHVLNNGNEARERPGSRYDHKKLEKKFSEHYPGSSKMVEELQNKLCEVREYVCGVTYEGENFEKALQEAIEKECLDTLVLAWWVEDDAKGPPVNCTLVSERCSIIFAKVHSERKQLTFSMASTQVSAATAAAAPPSSTASALTDKRSNNKTNSTSSKAPDGRETAGIATRVAQPKPSTEVSTLTPPAAASTEENNFKRTPKHSDREKADQPPTIRSGKNKKTK